MIHNDYRTTTCRVCDSVTECILDLGKSPLANALLATPDAPASVYPLGLCMCPACGLVQQRTKLPTDLLFDNTYPYYSGVSATLRNHAEALATAIRAWRPAANTALEIGSNDGTTQMALARRGLACVGVDPAAGPVEAARDAGCIAYCGAMDADMAETIKQNHQRFDVVTMSNVFAHVPNPPALLAAIGMLLNENGLLVIEVQSWLDLVERGGWDMVYHEHHSHFSLSSLAQTLERSGFCITECQHLDTQGGSLRVFCRAGQAHAATVNMQIDNERFAVATAPQRLREQVARFQSSLGHFVDTQGGGALAGYGAAAKTVTLLAVADGLLNLTCIADAAPSKIGKFLPLGGVPVVAPEDLSKSGADTVVLFARNLTQEILPTLSAKAVWSPLPSFARIA
jgi:ubiquinone/menaquinone biosynthesis C-methylase UbiE